MWTDYTITDCHIHDDFHIRRWYYLYLYNPLPRMPILGCSNSTVNKDMMSKIWTSGDVIIWLNRKHCGKRRNCSFPQCFQKLFAIDASK